MFLFKVPVSQKIAFISNTPSKLSVFVQIAICAFLGIFFTILFRNYCLQPWCCGQCSCGTHGFSRYFSFIFGRLVLKESIYIHSIAGTLLAVAGISLISWKGENSLLMLINASIAGTGYGLFSVLIKKNSD